MKKRDFPRALVFGFFIGAGAYIGASAWHVTGLAVPGLVLAAAVGAFLLSLLGHPYPDFAEAQTSRAAPQRERSNAKTADDFQVTPLEPGEWAMGLNPSRRESLANFDEFLENK